MAGLPTKDGYLPGRRCCQSGHGVVNPTHTLAFAQHDGDADDMFQTQSLPPPLARLAQEQAGALSAAAGWPGNGSASASGFTASMPPHGSPLPLPDCSAPAPRPSSPEKPRLTCMEPCVSLLSRSPSGPARGPEISGTTPGRCGSCRAAAAASQPRNQHAPA